MSWLRSAVNKAVEVGNNNFTRTFKNYADSVVHHAGQAVADGAKLFNERIGGKNIRSFKQTVKRELEKPSGVTLQDDRKSVGRQQHAEDPEDPRRHSMVLYYDSDMVGQPLSFRDVFLYSQALEGITICMILEPPNEDEAALLLELFSFCLLGGREVHNAIVSSIQDLAKAFSAYKDEVLVKREELLQFVEGAITGLKINIESERIDAEVIALRKQLDNFKEVDTQEGNIISTAPLKLDLKIEALKEASKCIRLCSRIEGLLLKKEALKHGDTGEIHLQKVDKLKVLSASLASSSSKAEKRISDSRLQKEDALNFRGKKANEFGDMEKELSAEISELEKEKNELEEKLEKVKAALSTVRSRLLTLREERDQFYEANDHIVAHLKNKEDELAISVISSRLEADVLSTWINFLEDTWSIQCSHLDTRKKEIDSELERHEDYFTNLVLELLSSYEKELRPLVDRIENYVNNLKSISEGYTPSVSLTTEVDTGDSRTPSPRRNLEEEYIQYESEIISTFSVVDSMREQFFAQQRKISCKEDPRVKVLLGKIEDIRKEFESIERPTLEIEDPTKVLEEEREVPSDGKNTQQSETEVHARKDDHEKMLPKEPALDPKPELAEIESELGKLNQDYSTEEIGEWEFDELEKALRSGEP